jgi:hypothetical protein
MLLILERVMADIDRKSILLIYPAAQQVWGSPEAKQEFDKVSALH